MDNTENTLEEQAEDITEDATVNETTEEGQEAEATGDQTPSDEPAETPAWAEKRFKKLAAQKHDAISKAEQAKREADYWRAKAQEDREKQTVAPATAKPTREQFDFDDEQYLDALTDWKIEERERARQTQKATKQREAQEYEQLTSFEQRRESTVNRGREKYGDFDDVVFSLPADVMDQEMAAAIFETDAPDEISYFLGKNPEKAAEIAAMSPLKKIHALGRLEGIMKAKTKKVTNAPPPIKPVGSGGSTTKTPATMTSDEYRRWSRENRSRR